VSRVFLQKSPRSRGCHRTCGMSQLCHRQIALHYCVCVAVLLQKPLKEGERCHLLDTILYCSRILSEEPCSRNNTGPANGSTVTIDTRLCCSGHYQRVFTSNLLQSTSSVSLHQRCRSSIGFRFLSLGLRLGLDITTWNLHTLGCQTRIKSRHASDSIFRVGVPA
jgi:hypothetical protein